MDDETSGEAVVRVSSLPTQQLLFGELTCCKYPHLVKVALHLLHVNPILMK